MRRYCDGYLTPFEYLGGMYLNREQEAMLEGEMGEGKMLAMKLLVNIGDVVGAPHLIPISSAHISGVSYRTGGDGLVETLREFVSRGAAVSVHSTLNPCGLDIMQGAYFAATPEFVEKQREIVDLYRRMGVKPTLSCIPYRDDNIPGFGEHISWAESNAVVFANSVLGARTNKEGSISALCAAIAGYTPYFGLHILENRLPRLEVKVNWKVTIWESQVLGAYIGSRFGTQVPLFNMDLRFSVKRLNRMGAALAAFGDGAILHVKGATPEAVRKLPRFEEAIEERTVVERKEVEEFTASVSEGLEGASTIVIGCPHLDFEELKELYKEMRGRRVRADVRLLLFTNRVFFQLAKESGIVNKLKEAGVEVYTDTCMVVSSLPDEGGLYLTDSLKAYFYMSRLSSKEVRASPLMSILNFAME
ncbi:MAG TPA: DUF521 domain-containing protein [Euryarchaeota archaeon]|nr:MAG: hypothetical protein DRN55_00100 [Thermoplasmata archaeon]HDD60354.1 DUF521 domain-containing protein [Euryarchaeota archaeon]